MMGLVITDYNAVHYLWLFIINVINFPTKYLNTKIIPSHRLLYVFEFFARPWYGFWLEIQKLCRDGEAVSI